MNVNIPDDIRDILNRSLVTSNSLKLPEQLERATYLRVAKVIENLGGQWNRTAEAHVFAFDPRERFGLAIKNGVAVDYQKKLQQFYTPRSVAERLVCTVADVRKGERVLEPSAGRGIIAQAAVFCREARVQCIELDPINVEYLLSLGQRCLQADFLQVQVEELCPHGPDFDFVLMNPPFSKFQDCAHIRHAWNFLKPGGLLVAICIHNPLETHFANPDRFTTPRAAILEQFAEFAADASIDTLEEGTFQDTDVVTFILTMRKPLPLADSEALDTIEELCLSGPDPETARGDKQALIGDDLHLVMASANNAGDVGKQQYFTPLGLSQVLAQLLCRTRRVAVDLQMGGGALLAGTKAPELVGCDIDSRFARKPDHAAGEWSCTHGDLTLLYPLLVETEWRADLFVLNPPFSLRWHTDRLRPLRESKVDAVRECFKAGRDTVDSTLATLMIALDRSTKRGEGYLICNESTAIKLFGNPEQASSAKLEGGALRRHIWLWVSLPAGTFPEAPGLKPCVLYFAADHRDGPTHADCPSSDPAMLQAVLKTYSTMRYLYRKGDANYSGEQLDLGTLQKWKVVKREYAQRQDATATPDYNMMLRPDGTISVWLTPFQQCSTRIPKADAQALYDMQGKTPMGLVVSKETRDALQRAVRSPYWRVQTALTAAVDEAVGAYNADRASFYPLTRIQRLAFLDESDTIVCEKDFPAGGFLRGERYHIDCSSEKVERSAEKINLFGDEEFVTYSGQELLVKITNDDCAAMEFGYVASEDKRPENRFSLHDLIEYFQIPEVQDIAQVHPEAYQENRRLIQCVERMVRGEKDNGGTGPLPDATVDTTKDEPRQKLVGRIQLPSICPAKNQQDFRYEGYQLDDLARAAIVDGCILAWEPGLGKTIAIFTYPIIKGAKITLIVAPGSLHQQIIDEGMNRFGVKVRPLHDQDGFYQDALLQKYWRFLVTGRENEICPDGPEFWITSYTALGYNRGDEWSPKEDDHGDPIVTKKLQKDRLAAGLTAEFIYGIGEENDHGIRCVHRPTLATLLQPLVDCAMVDEAVRMKADDSYISLGVRRLRPRFRGALTGTPIKNRLDDIFWLAQWAAGGHEQACSRWPYANSNAAREEFADQHMIIERNHTREANAAAKGAARKIEKRTAMLCNVQRLWKLLCNVVLRRRKSNIGRAIVPKVVKPVRVMAGTKQREVYRHHLANPPTVTKAGKAMNDVSALLCQLTMLRQTACCPESDNLGAMRVHSSHSPKQAATLQIIIDLLNVGEQVVVLSPFQQFSTSLFARLREAGVPACLLDGRVSEHQRGQIARDFKTGQYAVLVGGLNSMGEGHSFECCANLIIPSLDWALDKNLQGEDRVHRIRSPKPVTIWQLVTTNTIDDQLLSLYGEKDDSSCIALDGDLYHDPEEEVSIGQLLRDATANFDPRAETVDESALALQWEQEKKLQLQRAALRYQEWHPPIVEALFARPGERKVTSREVRAAIAATDGLVAPPDAPVVMIAKGVPDATYGVLAGVTHPETIAGIKRAFLAFLAAGHYQDWRQAWRAFDPSKDDAPPPTVAKPAPSPIKAAAQEAGDWNFTALMDL